MSSDNQMNRTNSARISQIAVGIVLALGLAPGWAQPPQSATPMDQSDVQGRTSVAGGTMPEASPMDHSKMNQGSPEPVVDHSQMDHSKMGHGPAPAQPDQSQMDHSQHAAMSATPTAGAGAMDPATMDHGAMQGGTAPPDARDPHAYSGGYMRGTPELRLRMADEQMNYSFLADRLEAVRTRGNWSAEYEIEARIGLDYDRAVLKAEGEVEDGRVHEARTELLWSHAVHPYWDVQAGVRHDSGEGPGRTWAAVGVQGLSPYWFEVDATAYVGEQGRTGLRVSAEYELLLTQRLVLQPRVEFNAYGKRDAERGLGSGFSDLKAGVRLRYEIRREFAPYIGVERAYKLGNTADLAESEGEDTRVTRWVAGVRFWF